MTCGEDFEEYATDFAGTRLLLLGVGSCLAVGPFFAAATDFTVVRVDEVFCAATRELTGAAFVRAARRGTGLVRVDSSWSPFFFATIASRILFLSSASKSLLRSQGDGIQRSASVLSSSNSQSTSRMASSALYSFIPVPSRAVERSWIAPASLCHARA